MYKTLAPAIAVLLSGCAASGPAIEPLQLATRVSFWVEMFLGEAQIAGGTANPISPDLFLTAAHVVELEPWMADMGPVSFKVGGHEVIEIILLEGLDAALLRTAPHGIAPWPMDERVVDPGEALMLTGWGYGTHRFSRHYGCVEPTCSSGALAPGDSGGALLDADGDIVAIVVAVDTRRFADHHAFVVPATDILAQMRLQGVLLA